MAQSTTQQILFFFENAESSTEVRTTSRKYRCFDVRMKDGSVRRYWVGKAGAVRVGRTIAESVPSEPMKRFALAYYKMKNEKQVG